MTREERSVARREAVLDSALATFVTRGYRRTSMEEVAAEARISRPGLYLHFQSKPALLRAAVEHGLECDVAGAEQAFGDVGAPFAARLEAALASWAGRWVGPLTVDLDTLLAEDPALLAEVRDAFARRFRAALETALSDRGDPGVRILVPSASDVPDVADLLQAVVAGIKRQAVDEEQFRVRLARALGLLLR